MTSTAAGPPADVVVLLGGRAAHEFHVLRELGTRIVYLEDPVPLRYIPVVDVPVDVRFDDWDGVVASVRRVLAGRAPAAVLTHVEPHIPLAAHLAEQLGLAGRGLSPQAALTCRDKWRTRQALAGAGVPAPRCVLAHSARDAVSAAAEMGFPVVVKPRGGAGGLGVRWCDGAAAVAQAAEAVLDEDAASRGPTGVLVEEYVPGTEYAVQTLTRDGETTVVSVFRQDVTAPPVFVETGYEFPSGLPPAEAADLAAVVRAAVAAVGVDNWITHTQVRSGERGEFRVIEVNARRPGGRLVDMTTAVSGIDLVRAASELALGRDVTVGTAVAAAAGYRSIAFDTAGTLFYDTEPVLDSLESVISPIIEFDVGPGEPVLPAQHPEGGVYGRIVAFGRDLAEVRRDLDRIAQDLRIDVDPGLLSVVGTDGREFKSCC